MINMIEYEKLLSELQWTEGNLIIIDSMGDTQNKIDEGAKQMQLKEDEKILLTVDEEHTLCMELTAQINKHSFNPIDQYEEDDLIEELKKMDAAASIKVPNQTTYCTTCGNTAPCAFCLDEDEVKLEKLLEFEMELTKLINKYSFETESDTPDYVLSAYLVTCLENWNTTCKMKKEF